MGKVYTAKAADIVLPVKPPSWNPDWPFPGAYPPGYDPTVREALLTVEWSLTEVAPGETDYGIGLIHGRIKTKDYYTDHPDGQFSWSDDTRYYGGSFTSSSNDYSEVEITADVGNTVSKKWGTINVYEFRDEVYECTPDATATYCKIYVEANFYVFFNGEIENSYSKTAYIDDYDTYNQWFWFDTWLEIDGSDGSVTIITP